MESRDSHSAHIASPEGLFRFQVVSQVLTRIFHGQSKRQAVHEVASDRHVSLAGHARKVGARTLFRWLYRFQKDGLPGLEPMLRSRCEGSQVLSRAFLDFMILEKRKDPHLSVPDLIQLARQRGIVKPTEVVDRVTAYRACRRMGLSLARRKLPHDGDTRRFVYPHRMNMVLCDGKHFRAGASRKKRVALIFLDDATRFGLHAVVGTSENHVLFLRGLYECMSHHGFMDALYLDRGPGFISEETLQVVAQLNIPLIHGTAGYPQGHGKIEVFNRSVKRKMLRKWDGRPDIDPDCGALELRMQHYIRETYNQTSHSKLGNLTPQDLFFHDPRPLNFPPSTDDLERAFVVYPRRLVSNDHIVSMGSVDYEVPKGHAGTTVRLHKNLLNGQLGCLHEGRIVRLHPVDLAKNARARRGRGADRNADDPKPLGKSAADLAFEHDFSPLVDPDGGFSDSR